LGNDNQYRSPEDFVEKTHRKDVRNFWSGDQTFLVSKV